jgi:hypothetical protein
MLDQKLKSQAGWTLANRLPTAIYDSSGKPDWTACMSIKTDYFRHLFCADIQLAFYP